MLRKLILTETEKRQISSLHHLLNEEDGFATLQGYVRHKLNPVPNSQVKLFQNEKLIKGATTDENGFFIIENIPLGDYQYKITNKVEGFDDFEDDIKLTEPKVYDVKLFFRDTQSTKEVTVARDYKERTFLDVSVFDSDGKPLGPSKIEVFDSNNEPLIISKNITDDNGILNFIEISEENPGFKIEKGQKQCEKKVTVSIKASYNNISNTVPFDLCIFNGRIKDENGRETPTRYFVKNEEGDVIINTKDTNIVKIKINTLINYQLRVRDKENKEEIKTALVKVFSDKQLSKLIAQGESPLNGEIKREKLEDGDFEDTYKIYYQVGNDGYEPKKGSLNVSTKKNNNNYIDLDKIVIKPSKPPKVLDERACRRLTRSHLENMIAFDDDKITIEELGGIEKVKENANDVKNCYIKFKSSYPDRFKKIINRLINVRNDLSFFQLTFTKDEIRSIYGESKTMSLKNTIRKVVSESVENKSEKTLIEERFKFSLRGVNKKNLTETKRVLRNERYNLINFGYNKELVRESFLDVMKGLYGNDETNVLSDIKTRLGQRIADQVKNKQEEHEMILSAFNELSEDMIERAIKENRVDELSNEIATKALENYKTQFGTEGLSGIMIASVDENKFKQEVAKLIEPAIKDITTKMDEKLKQVQNAVSGGLNPTA